MNILSIINGGCLPLYNLQAAWRHLDASVALVPWTGSARRPATHRFISFVTLVDRVLSVYTARCLRLRAPAEKTPIPSVAASAFRRSIIINHNRKDSSCGQFSPSYLCGLCWFRKIDMHSPDPKILTGLFAEHRDRLPAKGFFCHGSRSLCLSQEILSMGGVRQLCCLP